MSISKVISTGITVFHKGDRVMYVSGRHGSAVNNPMVNSAYECAGTVVGIEYSIGDSFNIKVKWDNDTHNSYNKKDLMFLSADDNQSSGLPNPNIAFKRKKGGYYHGRR